MPGHYPERIMANSDSIVAAAHQAAEKVMSSRPRIAFDWKNQFDKLNKGHNTERLLLPHGKAAVAAT